MAIYCGAEFIERHVTILDKDKTKDGKVSIKPEDIKILKNFSKLNKNNQLLYLKKKFKFNFKDLKGQKFRKLSNEEILNRDYYKGRFVSKIGTRQIFNWEEINF